eukprot:5261586-Amphidinium_carterae.1
MDAQIKSAIGKKLSYGAIRTLTETALTHATRRKAVREVAAEPPSKVQKAADSSASSGSNKVVMADVLKRWRDHKKTIASFKDICGHGVWWQHKHL